MAHYSDYPIIFGADLNMTPDNKVINLLKEGLTEACQNHPLTFPADKPFETIDYIMLNNLAVEKFKVISYKTINETYASDHLPLIAVLRVK
jgi:endonuclease/exonuclease/phosphatase family metal-dependent hydrolase